MKPTKETARRCLECGAVVDAGEMVCWLCRRQLSGDAPLTAELVPAKGAMIGHRLATSGFQFSLESLLLIMTLTAVCLGALVTVPGIGALVVVIAVPALVRTCMTGMAARQAGSRASAGDKVLAFLASAAITWAAFMAAGIAFFAACSVSLLTGAVVGQLGNFNQLGEFFLLIAMIVCIAMSFAAFVAMFWLTWPRVRR